MSDELKHYKEKARRLEKEKEDGEQVSGCMALVVMVVGLTLIAITS